MIGRTIAHYTVLEKLGEGGMGVVYKARDSHLDRLVALKVLPAGKVADAERKRRFVQEARSASALNHPNIVTIHDISEADGADFIVMEYVAGKSLADLIPRHGIHLGEALKLAVPIADALAAAHAAGIVHRDFKPGNVMVGSDGRVKVVDFGLAKLADTGRGSEDDVTAVAGDRPRTAEGLVVGTAAYMSPEQADGKRVDARSDIFSFGAVLYEMLTGRRAFQGDSQASTLAAVLRGDPKPATQVVDGLPAETDRVISRCLRKDPERRFQGMADLKVALQELKEESDSGTLAAPTPARRAARKGWIWAGGALGALVLLLASIRYLGPHGEAPRPPLTSVPLTADPGEGTAPSFSPDGNQVAFQWTVEQEAPDIYLKLIGGGPPLRLTKDPAPDRFPAWSPDGLWIAFVRGSLRERSEDRAEVLLIPALGGPERRLAEIAPTITVPLEGLAPYLAWFPDGKSLVMFDDPAPGRSAALCVLSVASGEKRFLTTPPPNMSDVHPAVSPDGRTLAFVRAATLGSSHLFLLALSADGRAAGEPRLLNLPVAAVASPAWTPDGREILCRAGSLYLGDSRLWVVPVAGSGEPRPLATGENGSEPAVSRRGNRLVYSVLREDSDIWRVDLASRGARVSEEKLIASTRPDITPQYSPDGSKIAFSSERSGHSEIWICDRDGANPVQLTSLRTFSGTPRWFPDGRRIVFDSQTDGQADIYVIDTAGGTPRRITDDPSADVVPSVSADGKWILFASTRTGRFEIWQVPAEGGQAAQVTRQGGFMPFGSRDGKRVFFQRPGAGENDLWSVPAGGGEETRVLGPLFNFGYWVVEDGIFFIGPRAQGGGLLQFFDYGRGAVRKVADISGRPRTGLCVSPDRRYALVTKYESLGSDLMLVENFR
jgi:Tol biopolymer transport system component/serine/threonine protein kinase